jgi:hypothetical protein
MKSRGKCRTRAASPANAYVPAAIISRRGLIASLTAAAITFSLLLPTAVSAQADTLASWNDGPAKQAIVDFVKATTDKSGPNFVPTEERIATFDQDGTLWVEHPMYSQVGGADGKLTGALFVGIPK